MNIKVNKQNILRLLAPEKGYRIYWDSDLVGFGVRVTCTDVRSYILQKRVNGIERRITIGRYPGVSPEIARKEALKAIGVMAGGVDPVLERRNAEISRVTLLNAFERYLEIRPLKASTVEDVKSELNLTFADWHELPMNKISREMVKSRYLERCKRSPARANAAMRYLRAVYNLAISEYRDKSDKSVISSNPVAVLSESRLWRHVERRKTVLKPADLKLWIPAVKSLGFPPERNKGSGRLFPKLRNGSVHSDIFMFAALTGCRKGEILGLQKDDVDFQRQLMIFRDTKNGATHELPITKTLEVILSRRMSQSPISYIFGSMHDRTVPSNFRASYTRIQAQTGLRFTLHDLRRLVATSMERLGIPGYTIKAILNHKTGSKDVTGGYVLVDDDMKLAALEKLDDFLRSQQSNPNATIY